MSASIPTATAPPSTHPPRPPSAHTAEVLVLVGLVLQVIGGAAVIGGIAWLFGFSILFPFPYAWAVVTAAVVIGVAVVILLYLIYTYSYQRIRQGDYQGAQTPTLVVGIFSLFVGVLPGIFYLIGYLKLGDAVREQQTLSYGFGGYPGTGVPSIACRGCGRVYPMGHVAFCPSCGQKIGV